MRLLEDIRYSLRQFKNAPGFTLTAILTLALGIGATTSIFTLVQAVLLKSLPVTKPEELWRIGDSEQCCVSSDLQSNWSLFSYAQYQHFDQNTPGFAQLSAFGAGSSLFAVRRTSSGRPADSFPGEYVSGNYFSTFGITPYTGRLLSPHDDVKGAPIVGVISYRAWQEKFAKDPAVIGSTFQINSHPVTIIGVTPPSFYGDRMQNNPPAFWLPLSSEPLMEPNYAFLNEPSWSWLHLIGRIRQGENPKAIGAQLQVELRQYLLSPLSKIEGPARDLVSQQTLHLAPGGAGVQQMRNEYRDGLRLLMLISTFVLLIACANLANLMLVRASSRQQAISVRSALGASSRTLIRLAFTESIVLAISGGIAGIGVAFAATQLILALAFGSDYIPIHATPSLEVLGFCFLTSLVTGILFGIGPAWFTAHTNPVEALRGANRSTGRNATRWQTILVIAQSALSLVLLGAAGLLMQSLHNMHHQNFGFRVTNRYIVHIDPQMAGYRPSQLPALYQRLRENLSTVTGVRNVSFSLYTPMDGNNWSEEVTTDGEVPIRPGTDDSQSYWVRVSPHYFDAIGTKILKGRAIDESDRTTTRTVAVVNRTFEKKFIKDGNAVGKHFSNDKNHPAVFEIVGVAEDANYRGPMNSMRPMYFLAQSQTAHIDEIRYRQFEDSSEYLGAIAIEANGAIPDLEIQVRKAVSAINPDLAVIDYQSFGAQVASNLRQQSMVAQLTSLFGVLALALASIGLYGVTAYSVERRMSEMGIRLALGANRKDILLLVLRNAFTQVGIGLVIGIPIIMFGGRIMASQLYGVSAQDPLILSLTVFVLALSALMAAIVPARRAADTQPIIALRTQ